MTKGVSDSSAIILNIQIAVSECEIDSPAMPCMCQTANWWLSTSRSPEEYGEKGGAEP